MLPTNSDYDGDKDMETENSFSSAMLIFAAIMTIMIMIVGIVGNFLTVVALIRCPKVRNVAAAFIMSLCVADLLFCSLVLPFSAYRFIQGTWTPRVFLCKMIPFIQYGNIGVSLLCIAMITINRYIMIAHHSCYGKIYKKHWIAAMIIFCWVFAYGMQLPTLVGAWGTFDYDPKLGTCSIMVDDYGRSSKTALFITAFVIPCTIITTCYAKIFWVVHTSEQRLKHHARKQNSIPNNLRVVCPSAPNNIDLENGQSRRSSADSSSYSTEVRSEALQKQQPAYVKDQREMRSKRNEWRITKMVLAIFLSFVICYLPITIAKVADQDVGHPNLHILSYIMLYLSACLNPIIYVIMNKQYRKAYKTVLMCKTMQICMLTRRKMHKSSKDDGGGCNVAEKWKDNALNHNHSRTIISQISTTDPQNYAHNTSPPMSNPSSETSNQSNLPTMSEVKSVKLTVPICTAGVTYTNILMTNVKEKEKPVVDLQLDPMNNGHNGKMISSPNPTLKRINKDHNRITLVGGDVILEEEEEEEEVLRKTIQAQHMELNQLSELRNTNTEKQVKTPKPAKQVPVYVNANVLQQRKHQFCDQKTIDPAGDSQVPFTKFEDKYIQI